MTTNAAKILDIVSLSTEHLTAEGLYGKLKESGEKMSLATVYRYDKTIRHDHLICEKCGAISDAMLEDYREEFSKKSGVEVTFYDLKLFWLCDKCRAKSGGTK